MILSYNNRCIVYVLAIVLLAGCSSKSRWNPDVSKIHVDVKFIRLEKEFYSIDPAHFQEGIQKMITENKDVVKFFISRMHNFGRWGDPYTLDSFRKVYLLNPYMRDSLYPDVEKAYPQPVINDLQNDFDDAFRHIKYYYPNDSLPKIYTIINPFGYQAYTYGNNLMIALEFFLGENYRYYNSIEMPDYKMRTFRKEYILPNGLKTLFQARYDEDRLTDPTLLSKMIYRGKRMFFLDVMKPDMADSLKIEYTTKQLKWCDKYQADIWTHLVTDNLLYNTNEDKVGKYIDEGPFTNDVNVPQESSPRLGEWIGWQIVKKYMEKNPKVTLDELFKDKDYRKILKLSEYKP